MNNAIKRFFSWIVFGQWDFELHFFIISKSRPDSLYLKWVRKDASSWSNYIYDAKSLVEYSKKVVCSVGTHRAHGLNFSKNPCDMAVFL